MKDEAVDEACIDEAIDQAFRELVREGYLVDSGRRTWNELTGRYEFVLVAARKKLN